MGSDPIVIEYRYRLPSQEQETLTLTLDPVSLTPLDPLPNPLPNWTLLSFEQCENCPLSSSEMPVCPLAARLAVLTPLCNKLISFDMVDVEVVTRERTVSANVSAEQGICSLMGLVSAVSGCPHTAFFRPMARFHLPFATPEETLFRSTGSYLLVEYLRQRQGETPHYDLSGLQAIYDRVSEVNRSVAERLRAASRTDSALNAIVQLDYYAQGLSFSLERSLDHLSEMLAPFWAQSH
ncbi:MAG: hypothetical protein C0624_11100 [Desulfuromonas sp.]|nr:MAG: hypothetical protein C0624_11100 [Desulfuromonas sp.]